MDQRDFDFRCDRKTAKKLSRAMSKGEWKKLTRAEANALEDFITELLMQVGCE